MMDVIILAGGLGTRLKGVLNGSPKCLAPINGKPFLFYCISYLKKNGFQNFIFSLSYKSESVVEYINLNHSDINSIFSIDKELLGTGGAIRNALNFSKSENVLIVNGDTYFNFNTSDLLNFHLEKKSLFTIALKSVSKNTRYGIVEINEDNVVCNFIEKKESFNVYINSGFYIINRNIDFNFFPNCFSLEKDFLEKSDNFIKIYAKAYTGDFIDIGIPTDFLNASKIIK